MRTSAIGITSEPMIPPSTTREGERGFTLVELMVVIVIIGIASAAVVLMLPGDRSALRADAEDFAGRTRAIRDKAMIDNRATSIRITPLGYAFDERERGAWKPLNGDVTQGQLWRSGTQALVPGNGTMRITFDSTGVTDPARVTIRRGDRQVAVTIAYDGTIDVTA